MKLHHLKPAAGSKKSTHYCPGCGHGTILERLNEGRTDASIEKLVLVLSQDGPQDGTTGRS